MSSSAPSIGRALSKTYGKSTHKIDTDMCGGCVVPDCKDFHFRILGMLYQGEDRQELAGLREQIRSLPASAAKDDLIRSVEMGITIREGRPWVSHFLSYEGTIPRTVSWHVNRSSRDGVEIPEYATPARYRKKQSAADKANEQLLDLDGMKPVGTPIPEGTGAVQEVVEGVSKPVKETESKEQN